MADLHAIFMGLTLRNPFVVGASGHTANPDRIRSLEEAGAGAVVTASLFEEQIQHEGFQLDEQLHRYDNVSAEGVDFFPRLKHAGPKEHLMWVRRAKEAIRIPLIASLNAVNRETWVEYAQQLQDTGADGLELNFYATPSDPQSSAAQVEREQLAIIRAVRKKVKIPLSVKLSPFYTNPLHFLSQLDREGVNGFVLFNRLFQPDIDVEAEANRYVHSLSGEGEHFSSLRAIGLAFGSLKGDLCASGGILNAGDAAKLILAGASCVQVVSALYRNKISHLGVLVRELGAWMDRKAHRDLASLQGKMSARGNPDPYFYKRAQYVRQLLKADYAD